MLPISIGVVVSNIQSTLLEIGRECPRVPFSRHRSYHSEFTAYLHVHDSNSSIFLNLWRRRGTIKKEDDELCWTLIISLESADWYLVGFTMQLLTSN